MIKIKNQDPFFIFLIFLTEFKTATKNPREIVHILHNSVHFEHSNIDSDYYVACYSGNKNQN